jgi:hypothetical protein
MSIILKSPGRLAAVRALVIAGVAVFISACATAPQSPGSGPVDPTNADAVAAAVLDGYRRQDIAAIAVHTNQTNRDLFAGLIAGSEDREDLFGGWRGMAATNWDGETLPARFTIGYDGDREAIIPFAVETLTGTASLASGSAEVYLVIVLTLDDAADTSWGFEDVNRYRADDYQALDDRDQGS